MAALEGIRDALVDDHERFCRALGWARIEKAGEKAVLGREDRAGEIDAVRKGDGYRALEGRRVLHLPDDFTLPPIKSHIGSSCVRAQAAL